MERRGAARVPAARDGGNGGGGMGSGPLQRLAAESGAVARLAALQRLADGGGPGVAQLDKKGKGGGGKLIETDGGKYKKKEKERREAERVETARRGQVSSWLSSYGHAQAMHVAMPTAALDARNMPLATTFETDGDLLTAALAVISENEQKLNHWYSETRDARIVLWCYRDDAVAVRGRRKMKRPDWHQHATPMPPHPGFGDADPEDLQYIVGVFDRDAWSGSPKGLVTCYPSETQPS